MQCLGGRRPWLRCDRCETACAWGSPEFSPWHPWSAPLVCGFADQVSICSRRADPLQCCCPRGRLSCLRGMRSQTAARTHALPAGKQRNQFRQQVTQRSAAMDPRCLAHEGLALLDLAATASCGTSVSLAAGVPVQLGESLRDPCSIPSPAPGHCKQGIRAPLLQVPPRIVLAAVSARASFLPCANACSAAWTTLHARGEEARCHCSQGGHPRRQRRCRQGQGRHQGPVRGQDRGAVRGPAPPARCQGEPLATVSGRCALALGAT